MKYLWFTNCNHWHCDRYSMAIDCAALLVIWQNSIIRNSSNVLQNNTDLALCKIMHPFLKYLDLYMIPYAHSPLKSLFILTMTCHCSCMFDSFLHCKWNDMLSSGWLMTKAFLFYDFILVMLSLIRNNHFPFNFLSKYVYVNSLLSWKQQKNKDRLSCVLFTKCQSVVCK